MLTKSKFDEWKFSCVTRDVAAATTLAKGQHGWRTNAKEERNCSLMKNTDVSSGSSNTDTSRQYLSSPNTLILGHVLYRCLIIIWISWTQVSKGRSKKHSLSTLERNSSSFMETAFHIAFLWGDWAWAKDKETNKYRKPKKLLFFLMPNINQLNFPLLQCRALSQLQSVI